MAHYRCELAQDAMDRQAVDEAGVQLTQALALAPDSARPHLDLARLLARRPDIQLLCATCHGKKTAKERARRSALWLSEDVLRMPVPLPNQMRLKPQKPRLY